jgi:hypothetical protein
MRIEATSAASLVEYGETVRPRQQTAMALAAYLASGDANTSRALGAGAAELSEAVSWLVQELLDAEGDEQVSLDGLTPVSVRQDSVGSVTLAGSVITTDAQAFRPVLVTLSLWPGKSTISLAGEEDDAPWSHGGAERVPIPRTWRYVFTVRLPPTLSAEQLAAWSRKTGIAELRQLLYWRWDPMCVSDAFPRTADEYDAYAHAILGQLHHGHRRADIARYLRDSETELLGERHSDSASLGQLADRLIDWYEDSISYWLEHQPGRARTPSG